MGASRIARYVACASLLGASLLGALPAAAQDRPSATTDADRKAAAQRFADGEKAYKAGDFVRAGEAFEEANRLAPHPSATWNAARAWQRAGENARAANLYARYLREAAPNDPDRPQSTAALAELSQKLGRIEITGTDLSELTVDQRPVEASPVYVNPGTHVVQGKVGGVVVARTVASEAAGSISVALVREATPPAQPPTPPATATPPTATAAPTAAPAPAATEGRRKGWHPVVFFVAGGATLFSGAWTVWSGLDTLAKKDSFDKDKSEANLDEGKKAQTRTNFLIGFTATGAVFTAIAGIWLVGWEAPPESASSGRARTAGRELHVGVGPGTASVRGSF